MLDNIIYFQVLIILIINLVIFFFRKKLYQFINIEDIADGILKVHKSKSYSVGGIIFFINITVFLTLNILFNKDYIFYSNENSNEVIVLMLSLFSMFLVGLYDDKYNLNYIQKFLLLLIIIVLSLIFDKNLVITNINFTFTEKQIFLDIFSIPFTILCIMLFINALNLFDGIDLQVGTYIFVLSFYFIFKSNLYFFIPILIACTIFLYLNFKKEIFLGDSGTILLGFIISYFCIKLSNSDVIFSDQIFIIMMLPGIDMLRLFLIRIYQKQNPFKGDRNHLHHIMINKFGYFVSFLTIQFLILIPILLMALSTISTTYTIITTLIIYIYLVFPKKRT